MNYIYQFDIAAIIVSLAVISSFFARKTIPTRKFKAFVFEIAMILGSSTFDLISIYSLANAESFPIKLNYLINIIYIVTTLLLPFCFFFCIYFATESLDDEGPLHPKLLFIFPIIVAVFIVITTPVTGLAFYFDENLNYIHGPLFPVLFGISFFYLISTFVRAFGRTKILLKDQTSSIIFYSFASLIAFILQILIPNLMIVGFMASIATLHIFISVENPAKYIDNDTGCFNREAFICETKRLFQRGKTFRIVGIRISGLKDLTELIGIDNETFLIKSIESEITKICKKRNLYRLSTKYFAAILNDDVNTQQEFIIQLRQIFKEPFKINSIEISISDYITYLSCPKDAENVEDVLDLIENTLAEMSGKESGSVVKVNKQILVLRRRENQVLQVLKQAVRKTEFEVFFQPIYCLKKNRFTTAEALIRLKLDSDDYGFIGPEEFIPIAEKNGLILQIGEFVFENVCRFLVKERIWEKGIEYIHVNLSAVQCMQEKLASQLLSIMDAYHLDYKYINFEVTETAAIVSSEKLLSNMNKMIEKGINFALDDYGTGFSNTASLINYPFHTIKLDKSMVWAGFDDDNKAGRIVEHTINMVKSLNMEVIAEGVESPEQAQKLKKMGCDYIQGYLFSKPITGKQFVELLNKEDNNKLEF